MTWVLGFFSGSNKGEKKWRMRDDGRTFNKMQWGITVEFKGGIWICLFGDMGNYFKTYTFIYNTYIVFMYFNGSCIWGLII